MCSRVSKGEVYTFRIRLHLGEVWLTSSLFLVGNDMASADVSTLAVPLAHLTDLTALNLASTSIYTLFCVRFGI